MPSEASLQSGNIRIIELPQLVLSLLRRAVTVFLLVGTDLINKISAKQLRLCFLLFFFFFLGTVLQTNVH
jgi:hypothetical protein